jgi:hypothetical protein
MPNSFPQALGIGYSVEIETETLPKIAYPNRAYAAPFGLDFKKAMVKSEQTGLTVHD